jgi:hypothetical protein
MMTGVVLLVRGWSWTRGEGDEWGLVRGEVEHLCVISFGLYISIIFSPLRLTLPEGQGGGQKDYNLHVHMQCRMGR